MMHLVGPTVADEVDGDAHDGYMVRPRWLVNPTRAQKPSTL